MEAYVEGAQARCDNDKYLRGDGSCLSSNQIVSDIGAAKLFWFGNVGIYLKNGANAGGEDGKTSCFPYPEAFRYSASKIENEKVYTKAYVESSISDCACDSGWIEGDSASCQFKNGQHSATTNQMGVNGHPWQ